MRMLRRIAAALTRDAVSERLATLERTVRKLAEADRERMTALDTRLGDIARALEGQPTAKDLREIRQAVRGLTDRQSDRWLFDAIDQVVSSGRLILIGPWTGEVGFELLYWVPFVRWIRAHWTLPPDREVIVSRGGVASWYGRTSADYIDIFSVCGPDEFRTAVAEERRKRRRPGAFDDRVVEAVARKRGTEAIEMLHPGLMYRMFAAYWSDEAGYARIDQFTRHELLTPPADVRPPGLPADYVAVRFYFSECFPETADNRAFARGVVLSLAERVPVVVLNPGFSVDEHADWTPDATDRIIRIAERVTPESNLAVQSAVIAGARAFVGTYGGYSYLAPLYRVPALAFYSRPSFKLHHLHAAQRAFGDIDAAALMPLDVAHAGVVQLALGALVAA